MAKKILHATEIVIHRLAIILISISFNCIMHEETEPHQA
jgi:hypothetical protein